MAGKGQKRRLGVALLLEAPLASEVDGLRRALGDPSLGRIAPHLTLVPPVNVRPDQFTDALRVLREAAARLEGPLTLTLGPVRSFLPANPVLFLDVGGDLEALRRLRDAVFSGPLERKLSWPWVPHVTVADGIEEDRVLAGVEVLCRYGTVTEVDRVVLLEELPGRQWAPLADCVLGPAAVVARGGLDLQIHTGTLLDPEADDVTVPGPFEVVLTGRRDGVVVGTAAAWRDRKGGHVLVRVEESCRRQGIGGHLLSRLEVELRRRGWADDQLVGDGPASFFRARSGWTAGVDAQSN